MPRALVNGTELFYEVDGDGAPCVVLHGVLGVDHTLYRRTLGPLSPPMQLIYLDHRCNGRSGRPPLEHVESVETEVVGEPASVAGELFHRQRFGHSCGGFVAQELAIEHADRVAALLLVATTPGQLGSDESPDHTEQGPPPPPEVIELTKKNHQRRHPDIARA